METGLRASRLRQLFPKSAFTRSIAVLTGANVIGQIIVVVASPLLTRLYSPEQMGMLSAFTSLLMILLAVACWLYEMAIPLPDDPKRAVNLVALSIVIVIGMSIVSGLGIVLFGEHIAKSVNTPALTPYLWILPIALLGAGMYQALNYWAVREKQFACVARTRMHESTAIVLTQLGLGLLKWGAAGLLIGIAVGRLVSNVALIRLMYKQHKQSIKSVSTKMMREVAYRYRRFPLISSWSSLLNAIAFQLPYLLLTGLYGPHVLGLVALAQRVLGLPFNLLGTSVGQVYLAEAARLKRNPYQLHRLFWKTVKNMAFLGIPVIGLIIFTAPWAFAVVFGSHWMQSGQYLQAMGVMFLMQLVATPIKGSLYVLERQDLLVYCEICRTLFISGSLFLAWNLDQPAMMAVVFMGVAGAIGNFLPMFFSWRAIGVYRRQGAEGVKDG